MARFKQIWTEGDVARLRELAGTKPVKAIAEELGRTTGSVIAKAAEHGLPIIVKPERIHVEPGDRA